MAGADAPSDATQGQGRQLCAQSGVHVCQSHVHAASGGLAALHVDPGPYRAVAARQRDVPQVGMLAQLRYVHTWKHGVQLSAPAFPGARMDGQQGLAQLPHQGEALAPVWRRRRVEAQAVAPAAVAQHDVYRVQGQRRCWMQGVAPVHRAAAHHHFALGEEPVGGTTIAGAPWGERQAGNEQLPVSRTPDIECGPLDIQLLKPPAQQRARRQRHHHARQLQRGAPIGVEQCHVFQFERGHQHFGACVQGANAHGYPQGARGVGFELRAEFVHTRHNQAVQQPPRQGQQKPQGQQQAQGPAREAGDPSQQTGWVGDRFGHGARECGGNYHPRPRAVFVRSPLLTGRFLSLPRL